jgi:hypothetical protein
MKKLLLFLIILFTTISAQEIKLIKRTMTDAEFKKFKDVVGTYEDGKNYNQIIDGHGTGLKPPTEEQWEEMKNQPILIEGIEPALSAEEIPPNCDNSKTPWFPPISNQGSQGSCVSWAYGYYATTFQEAKEHNWDLSGCTWDGGYSGYPTIAYQDKIFSPAFIYNQVNWGRDEGSGYTNNIHLLENVGCCTWDKMPYDQYDYTSWPNENAWRQAPWYRSKPGYGVGVAVRLFDTDTGIVELKQFLSNGNLVPIAVDAGLYSNLSSKDLWTLDSYNPTSTNHANTIVGYNDNYGPYTESGNPNTYGAFKVANSWGIGMGGAWEHVLDGFYYISYECMKQRIEHALVYENLENYTPQMVAVFEMNHNFRGENLINFGLGDPNSPSFNKSLSNFSAEGGNYPFPNNPIVIDITEFIPYQSGSTDRFFMKVNDGGTSVTGTIQYFSVEMYDDYASGIPQSVYVSSETPISTQQDIAVYANIFTSSETIYITFPSGGEIFDVGSSLTIKYTTIGTSGYVNLDYSTDRGTNWNPIANNVIDNGEYRNWIIPNTSSADCKIRVSDADGNPKVISKGLFGIVNEGEFIEQTSIPLTGTYNSSLDWGDYDNDGDLDILLTGGTTQGRVSKIYRNDGNNSFSEQTSILLTGVSGSQSRWGDYDNDGYLDILLTGYASGDPVSKIYRNNGGNSFTEQESITLPGIYEGGSAAWGDYDNDGDLDILLCGTSNDNNAISKIYRNDRNNTFTEQSSISLPGISISSANFGDYDNDGNLDILLTGADVSGGGISKIYRNEGNNEFIEQSSINLTAVSGSSAAWGDYDNDGYLDIILAGNSIGGLVSKIYRNNRNNSFIEQVSLADVFSGSVAWGDYDNDGDLDILLCGQTNDVGDANVITKLYRNNGNNTFSDALTPLTGVAMSSLVWGDYDNDSDLDILFSGYTENGYVTKIYSNNNSTPNTLPTVPSGLNASINGSNVTFSWEKSTDNETPQNGLTYNLVIGTSPGACDILSPMSDINTGKRRIVSMGNAGHCNSKTIKELANGQYFWSVQTIDNNFAGSNFASTQSFTIDDTFTQFTEQTEISLTGIGSGSAVWGDYDNDGDLDIIGIGEGQAIKIYKNNGDNNFIEQTEISLTGSCFALEDYDNDGYMDILVKNKIYHNNGNNIFIEKASIPGLSVNSAAWGDYDNDGDLDILITGSDESNYGEVYLSKIYRNDGNNIFTEQTSTNLLGVIQSSIDWGDYDNDGDLDILLMGAYSITYVIDHISTIYRNNGNNTFTSLSSAHLKGFHAGSASWGDYDDDGDLDILFTGSGSELTIYRNDGNDSFTEISIPSIFADYAAWGDYDNDGDLDILLTGGYTSSGGPISEIYRNEGDDTFTEQPVGLIEAEFGNVIWGDYDNDGDLDILLNGYINGIGFVSKIYRNNNVTPNTTPTVPTNLKTIVDGNNVTFSWDKSIDNETPQNGLTYNLVIGTSPGAYNILSPMSDINTGKRRVVGLGNTNHDTSWSIKNLHNGVYYWRVQAIDNNFAGSEFAATKSFVIQSPRTIVITYPKGGESFEAGSNPIITYSSLGNSGYVNLDYSIDGGITWDTIATNQPDDGDYGGWIVPNSPSTNCKIRISDVDGDPSVISDSLFTITGVIPVELVSFTANANKNKVILQWKTTTETNNKGFEIQRELNSEWEKINYVNGHGTTTVPKEYSYEDNFEFKSYKGVIFYRLKQIDLDGSFHYSEELKLDVDFTPKEYVLYQSYPNPFNPFANIKFALPHAEKVSISIYNSLGEKVLLLVDKEYEAGVYKVELNATDLASGIYFYSIKAGNFSQTKKMVLLR